MQPATLRARSEDIEPAGGGANSAFVTVAGSAEAGDIRQAGCGNLHLYLSGNATVRAVTAVTVCAGLARFVATPTPYPAVAPSP